MHALCASDRYKWNHKLGEVACIDGSRYVREASDQMVQKDGSFQPGQIQPRAQPSPTTERSKATSTRVLAL